MATTRDPATLTTAELAGLFCDAARAFDTAPDGDAAVGALAALDGLGEALAARGIRICGKCLLPVITHAAGCMAQAATVNLPGCES